MAFDAAIRNRDKKEAQVFLHRSCQPLDQAPIDDVDPGQGDFWNQECQGMCGV